MKISNELLSAVLGCDCEFIAITEYKGFNRPTYYKLEYLVGVECEMIPLDTFIRIAKNGYETYSQERDLLILEDALNNKTLECCK